MLRLFPAAALISDATVYSVLFPTTVDVTSTPSPSTTVVVSSLDVIMPSNSSKADCTLVVVMFPAGVTSTSPAF